MLSRLFPMLLLSAGLGLAQDFPHLTLIDLKLGKIDAPDYLLVELGRISTGIVFQRLPHTTICPTWRNGEFALEKVNPNPRRAGVSEHISSICPIIDSVVVDTTAIYKVHTPMGEAYYMQMIERLGERVRVRLTTEVPVAVRARPVAKLGVAVEGPAYRLDGRALPDYPPKAPGGR